jgi:hypothetical protein
VVHGSTVYKPKDGIQGLMVHLLDPGIRLDGCFVTVTFSFAVSLITSIHRMGYLVLKLRWIN